MSQRPTYRELAQRVKALEKEVAECKQAEKRLWEDDDKYQLFMENFNDPIWVFDRNGTAPVASSSATKYLGGRPEDYIGRSIRDFLPEISDFLLNRLRQVIETGKGDSYEDLIDLPSGKIWIWSNIQPVKDAEGDPYAVQVISHDITERKQAEEALKASVEYLQLHSDLANTLIKLHPSEFGKVVEYFLHRMVEILGVDRGILVYWPEGDISSREIYSWKREGIKPYIPPRFPMKNCLILLKKYRTERFFVFLISMICLLMRHLKETIY